MTKVVHGFVLNEERGSFCYIFPVSFEKKLWMACGLLFFLFQ